jgi:hypothetical protein
MADKLINKFVMVHFVSYHPLACSVKKVRALFSVKKVRWLQPLTGPFLRPDSDNRSYIFRLFFSLNAERGPDFVEFDESLDSLGGVVAAEFYGGENLT